MRLFWVKPSARWASKYNGGVPKDQLSVENLEALKKGIVNLEKHIENIQKFGVPVIVTLNSFISDTDKRSMLILSISVRKEAVNLLWLRSGKRRRGWACPGRKGIKHIGKTVPLISMCSMRMKLPSRIKS